ncbi:MAG: hypothetical protein ACD_8C00006G0010 [uncultured bacterium]|nr:MAG: hypothetical protein ACD_8C00006G0010 [uncultured bacterium]
MEYEKYLEKGKTAIKESTIKQRIFAGVLLLILLGIGIFLLNPEKKLLERRNSQRRSDVVNILNAVYQYGVDNEGKLPQSITNVPTMICQTGASSCDGLVDLSAVVEIEKKLLSEVPMDPKEKSLNGAGYQISKLSNGRINVTAPLAENNAVISLSK